MFVLILGVPAAYSLARFEFPIRFSDIAPWFLSQRVLPPAVVLVPFYLLMVQFRPIDTGPIFRHSTFNLALAVVIMRDLFLNVSTAVEDAAKVEGATAWQVLWTIALPLSRPPRGHVRAGVRLQLERGAVRLDLHLTGCNDVLGPRRLGQHPDWDHSVGDPVSFCAALSRPRLLGPSKADRRRRARGANFVLAERKVAGGPGLRLTLGVESDPTRGVVCPSAKRLRRWGSLTEGHACWHTSPGPWTSNCWRAGGLPSANLR